MQLKLFKWLFFVLSTLSLLSIILVNAFWDFTDKSRLLDVGSDVVLVVLALTFGYLGYRVKQTK
jgi:uncharacterized membrane protein YqjE